jgi:hypothetical protein
MRPKWVWAVSGTVVATLIAATYIFLKYSNLQVYALTLALAGIAVGIIIPIIFEWLKEPDFDIDGVDTMFKGGPPFGGVKILKIVVKSKRNFVTAAITKVEFSYGITTKNSTGKWDDQPEPVLQLPPILGEDRFQGWLTTLVKAIDIPPRQSAKLAVAIKIQGDAEFYMFDPWSYQRSDYRLDEKRIPSEFQLVNVLVEIQSSDVRKSKKFLIRNPSTSIESFSIEPEPRG